MRAHKILLIALLACGAAAAPAQARHHGHGGSKGAWQPPETFDEKIAELAKKHHVPERLIHRVIMRESRYNPAAVHSGNYGLMQIRYGTARSMGYQGSAMGLCDGITNLTYAVPYLANAYNVAGQNEDRAVQLYASGFYYVAKRQGALSGLQMASAVVTEPVAYVAAAAANPIAALFGAIAAPADAAVSAANAESAAAQAQMVASHEADAAADNALAAAPLPPSRPRAFSTARFLKVAALQDPVSDTAPELRPTDAQ